MKLFKLVSGYKPIVDQKKSIEALSRGIENKVKYQVLLGVTGSGKTFTIANVIEKLQMPALIISHNKTLAGQLYQEFRDFFPDNHVSYFVSYYDYYQPESYIPSTDTYIEKDADINELIDKLRLSATNNILSEKDTVVVSSVSCIYNLGSPAEYEKFSHTFSLNENISRESVIKNLVGLQYERSEYGFHRGTFRVRGGNIDIYPAYQDIAVRITISDGKISEISLFNPLTGSVTKKTQKEFVLYPAKHFITDPIKQHSTFKLIENDLRDRIQYFEKQNKPLEAYRIKQRVEYDIGMIKELGYVKGIENYSRYFDGRISGQAPYTLIDYFNYAYKDKWLLIVDESHMTFPQIRGMYNGDFSRKQTLIDFGFRLPSAIDNRPLKFEEFMKIIPNYIATSATPSDWEISNALESANTASVNNNKTFQGVIEQLVRPTGITDPEIEIRPAKNEVADVIKEIIKEIKNNSRTLVTTLTKKTAEELTTYLEEKGLKVAYLHSDVDTLERTNILDSLREGKYDCLIGVNLLREGLDLPEVTLVAILDADKEGFLRSRVSLIQTMGRAARHIKGRVILYADNITNSIKCAVEEVDRRREFQINYNKINNITPKSIEKPIRKKIVEEDGEIEIEKLSDENYDYKKVFSVEKNTLTPLDVKKITSRLRRNMKEAAENLDFELAVKIRDKIKELEAL